MFKSNGNNVVSIIVPVYNTDIFFLDKCLHSISSQSYKNIEIIIVDSSTNESTISYIEKYKELDCRVRVLKSKIGVSHQRNVGIQFCNGEFIAFIDSDDHINKDYIQKLMDAHRTTGAEVVSPIIIKEIYSYNKIIKTIDFNYFNVNELITNENFFIYCNNNVLVHPVKLYKKELVNGTTFFENLSFGEDLIFNYELSKKTFKYAVEPSAKYYYTGKENTNAASRRLNKNGLQLLKILYKIQKSENSIDNKDGAIKQLQLAFDLYFEYCLRTNKILWMGKLIRYRVFFASREHNLLHKFTFLFPFVSKIFKFVRNRITHKWS